MNAFNMTCEAVEVTLPDYLDETLEAWVRTSVQQHLSECMRCSALVRDLRNLEREAAALPDLVPARDLWAGIAERIGAPMVALDPAPVVALEPAAVSTPQGPFHPVDVVPLRPRRIVPAWIGAAAAALVVLTAGTTYLLTTRAIGTGDTPLVAGMPVTVTALPGDAGVDSSPVAEAVEPDAVAPDARRARGRAGAPRREPRVTTVRRSTPAQAVYEREIEMLQAIMTWRRAELEPSTAATIEKNLKIIDAAIAESRAALRRDPASSMLSDQLSHTLDRKVELLRTAAMLPART